MRNKEELLIKCAPRFNQRSLRITDVFIIPLFPTEVKFYVNFVNFVNFYQFMSDSFRQNFDFRGPDNFLRQFFDFRVFKFYLFFSSGKIQPFVSHFTDIYGSLKIKPREHAQKCRIAEYSHRVADKF